MGMEARCILGIVVFLLLYLDAFRSRTGLNDVPICSGGKNQADARSMLVDAGRCSFQNPWNGCRNKASERKRVQVWVGWTLWLKGGGGREGKYLRVRSIYGIVTFTVPRRRRIEMGSFVSLSVAL